MKQFASELQYSDFSIHYEPTHVSLHASMRWDASSNNVMGHCCQNSEKCWAAPDMTDKYQHPMVKTASFWLWRRQWGCFLPTWSKYSITLLAQVDCGFPWHAMSPDWKYKLYIITVQDARRLGWWSWCLIVSWWANNEIHFNYTQPQLHTILICLSWDVKFWAMMTELLLKNCSINALFAVFIMITVVKKMCRCENDISQHLHMRRTGVTISPLSGVCRSPQVSAARRPG